MSNKINATLPFSIEEIIPKSQELNIEDILKKICVSPPYFAFKKIYKYQQYIIAPVKAEQFGHKEKSKISIVESGRHIAILGSVANSIKTTEKHYYLAQNASMNHYKINHENDLYVVIESYGGEQKLVTANGLIADNHGQIIYDLSVDYLKIKKNVFCKLFKSFFNDTPIDKNINPYCNIRNLNQTYVIKNNKLEVSLDEFLAQDFSGHFDQYPAIPVSISCYLMTHYAGILFQKINKVNSFVVEKLSLEVYSIFSCNETIELEIFLKDDFYECLLIHNDKKISKMKLKIRT
jgi:hypothetical protein